MVRKSLVDILSNDDIKILVKVLVRGKCKDKRRENLRDILKQRIRYKMTKKIILFYLRFMKMGIDSWQMYNCRYSLKKVQAILKNKNIELSNFTRFILTLSKHTIKVPCVYYITSNRISSQYIANLPEGLLLRLSKTRFILSNKELEKKIDDVVDANKLTDITKIHLSPYRINQIIKAYNKKIVSIVYSTNPEITGVKGLSEIELRGDDVITGLSYLLARLDKFCHLATIFGPIIRIKFENNVSIDIHGRISAKSIDDILDFLSHLDILHQQRTS